jgi:GT2 family glycosyltransferase
MSSPVLFSVLLCVRSLSAPLLSGALQSLREQSLPSREWELILVANESVERAKRYPQCAGGRFVLMHEARPGLLWARLLGFSECRGQFIVLMDDDARLGPDFLANAKRFVGTVPSVAVVGGTVAADPDGSAVPDPLKRAFSLRTVERSQRLEDGQLAEAPAGVGLVVRSDFFGQWQRTVRERSWKQALGRRGALGGAGEDVDLVANALGGGKEVWLCPELQVRHFVPPDRLRPCYLQRLIRVNNLGWNAVWYRHFAAPPVMPSNRCGVRLLVLRALSLWNAWRGNWERLITLERQIALLLTFRGGGLDGEDART